VNLKVLIAASSIKLAVQNFSTGELLWIDASDCGFAQINGFYLDEILGDLFIYGSGIIKTSLKLATIVSLTSSLSSLSTSNMSTCLFLDGVCVCKVD